MDGWTGREFTRREVLRAGAVGTLGISAAALLAACQGGKSEPSASPSAAPTRGGELTVALISGGAFETLSVATAINTPDIVRIQNLYEGLFGTDDQGAIVPALATQAEANSDATVWTVSLRDGVTFHDGKPFTADDVVYTVNSWGETSSYFQPIASQFIDFKGVRKLGNLVVEIPLTRGVGEFPSITVFFNAFVVPDGFKDGDTPNGTGPFRYVSFDPGKRSEFDAFANYWGGAPYVDRLVVDSSITTEEARVNSLLAGDSNVVVSMPFTLARANADSGQVRISQSPGRQFNAFRFRVDQAPFSDPRVMQALKLVVDRQQMVDVVYGGYADPGNDLAPVGGQFFDDVPAPGRDVEQAASLLKAAGAEGLSFTLETATAFPGQVEGATLFAEQAKEAGINVKVEKKDTASYFTFDGGLLSRTAGQTYWYTLPSITSWYIQALWSGAPYNETHWGGDKNDSVLFDAMGAVDPALAEEKWRAVQELQLQAGGYIMYVNPRYVDGYANSVQGIAATPAGWANNFTFKDAWVSGS